MNEAELSLGDRAQSDASMSGMEQRSRDLEPDPSVGEKLRSFRRARKMSLAEVASQVGISASFLSQVETGKVQPSVATLLSVANLFGASLDDLFGRAVEEPVGRTQETRQGSGFGLGRLADSVVRAEGRPSIKLENGVMWDRLCDGDGSVATTLLVTYEPGGRDTLDGRLKRHAAWEFGYLLEGRLELQLEFERVELLAGDSFHFDSDRPHLFHNTSDQIARGIWFVLHKHDAP